MHVWRSEHRGLRRLVRRGAAARTGDDDAGESDGGEAEGGGEAHARARVSQVRLRRRGRGLRLEE